MSDFEPTPMRGWTRVVAQGALVLAIFAGTIFIVVLVFGSGGVAAVAEVFGPIAVGVTVLALAASVTAIVIRRSRVLGIVSLVVLLPSIMLSLLTLVALGS